MAEGGEDDNRRGGKSWVKKVQGHEAVIRDVNIVARAAALTISTRSLPSAVARLQEAPITLLVFYRKSA